MTRSTHVDVVGVDVVLAVLLLAGQRLEDDAGVVVGDDVDVAVLVLVLGQLRVVGGHVEVGGVLDGLVLATKSKIAVGMKVLAVLHELTRRNRGVLGVVERLGQLRRVAGGRRRVVEVVVGGLETRIINLNLNYKFLSNYQSPFEL